MDSRSVDVILDFLRKNNFTRAEAALLSELSDQCDVNGALQKLSAKERISSNGVESRNGEMKNSKSALRSGDGVSNEFVIEEIGCKTGNRLDSNCSSTSLSREPSKCKDLVGISSNVLASNSTQECPMLDLYPVRLDSDNGSMGDYQNGVTTANSNSLDPRLSEQEKLHSSNELCMVESDVASTDRRDVEDLVRKQLGQLEELDAQPKFHGATSIDNFFVPFSRSGKSSNTKLQLFDDCSVETLVPLANMEMSTSYPVIGSSNKKDQQKITYLADAMLEVKEQVDEVGRSLYSGGSQEFSDIKYFSTTGSPLVTEKSKEEFPRLRPVRIKSEDKFLISNQEKEFLPDGTGVKFIGPDNSESYLDIPVGQNKYSGETRITGSSWLSVSQGISEDISDLVSAFATVGGTSESADYQNEYWDSDEYDDDEDVGYMRQPIEDESWFLAHEIDYPSDNEKQTGHRIVSGLQESAPNREEGEGLSFAEEDSYLSGDHYYEGKIIEPVITIDDASGLMITEMYQSADGHYVMDHDGKLIEEDKLNLMHVEPMWKGCTGGRGVLHDVFMDQDQHDCLRSVDVGMTSDSADIGSDVRGCIAGGSSEVELEYLHRHATSAVKPTNSHHVTYKKHIGGSERFNERSKPLQDKFVNGSDEGSWIELKNQTDCGFSFSLSLEDGQLLQQNPGETLRSNNCHAIAEDADDGQVAIREKDDMLLTWKHTSGRFLLEENSNDENSADAIRSEIGHVMKVKEEMIGSTTEEDTVATIEDEEVAAMQEQLRQIKTQEEEFETFNLKIVHRKNRTGFEEEKNFNIALNSIIAGRYHVTEYLGSAAFSKAIQAHDLCTGIDVCVKIIKNNKDFFDQSLDEIKLLKFVNKNDPGDKYHVLRLYDYFYYREHLLIVCELLKANLYEFQKFNRESGGEVYFTMPRLQSITIQCLEALVFLHGLGLIHSDLKPENILIKSYSRCEVKIIDLGSSCFETDHLCSYVQSRSYRAPEVFLGLLYDRKIDIWSLGCILAELCSGSVLFQNDSPATLLARVIGIIGPIDQGMLTRGRDTHKYFTKNHMLYERNQETNRLEYLIPKKSSLKHRLPMGDEGFIQFVAHLLETDPDKRPSAAEALRHSWLSHPYEPISS